MPGYEDHKCWLITCESQRPSFPVSLTQVWSHRWTYLQLEWNVVAVAACDASDQLRWSRWLRHTYVSTV